MVATREEIVDYIRSAALARGVDPDIAVRVAESEGLNADPAEGWQSYYVQNGVRERSYGPFQLYIDGGLGNVFMEQTGLDPRDPSTVFRQIDFALDQARQTGWSPWYGAARVGIGDREGLDGVPTVGSNVAEGVGEQLFSAKTPTSGPTADPTIMEQLFGEEGSVAVDEAFNVAADALAGMDFSGGRRQQRFLSENVSPGRQNVGSSALSRMGIASLA